MTENKQLVNGIWVDAKQLQFYYPHWIEIIPIKCVRKIAKKMVLGTWGMVRMADRKMEGLTRIDKIGC